MTYTVSSGTLNPTQLNWHELVHSCPFPPLDNIRIMVVVWRLRGNIIRTALCWIVWHNVHSLQHTYMSSSYTSNRLGLSHWDPYAVCRGSCLELYYCNMVEWFWWDSSLITTTSWFPSVLWHCWFGHLACKIIPEMNYNVLSGRWASTLVMYQFLSSVFVTIKPVYLWNVIIRHELEHWLMCSGVKGKNKWVHHKPLHRQMCFEVQASPSYRPTYPASCLFFLHDVLFG